MVSRVYWYNQDEKFPKIQNDIREISNSFPASHSEKESESIFCMLKTIPPVRRLSALPEKIENGDFLPAAGIAAVAFANLPSDLKDMKVVGEQVSQLLDGKIHHSVFECYNNQEPFRFLKGTLFQIPMDWFHQRHPELAKKIFKYDKSIYETKFGCKFSELMGCIEKNLGKWSVRALKRVTILGVAFLAAFEIPKIIKSAAESKDLEDAVVNSAEQTAKSAFTVTSTTASIAYMGALGSKCGGIFGSVAGMGAGAVFGSYLSQKFVK